LRESEFGVLEALSENVAGFTAARENCHGLSEDDAAEAGG